MEMVLYMLKQFFIKMWPISKPQLEQSVKSLSQENKVMIEKSAEKLQADLNLLQSKLNEDLQEIKKQLKDDIENSYQDLTEKIQKSLQLYGQENKSVSNSLKDDLKKDIKEVRMAQYQREQPLDIRFDRGYYASFDVSPSLKFQQDFLSLVRGLDKESVETVVLALQRLRYIQGVKWNTSNLYSEEEKIEARKIKEHFQKAVFPISDECFYYNGYMLPLNHFESCVFWDHCGVHELDNPEYFKDKDIIDAGAFIGDSALILSPLTNKKVYAFEPTQSNYNILLKTLAMNQIKNTVPIQMALGNKNKETEILVRGSSSSQKENPYFKYEKSEDIQMITLDEYVAQNNLHVGLIKVDVEGAEQMVLQGAIETIKTQRPTLLLSIYHNRDDFFNIKRMIEDLDLGYRLKIRKPITLSVLSEMILICEP